MLRSVQDELVHHMRLNDAPDGDELVGAERHFCMQYTFEGDRTRFEPRGPHFAGRHCRQPGQAQLFNIRGCINAGDVHGLGHLLRYQVHHELARRQDVATGVLHAPVELAA